MCENFEDYPDLLTIDDVREMLGIGRNTAYALCKNNIIPCRKIGNKWRIAKSSVLQYLTQTDPISLHFL